MMTDDLQKQINQYATYSTNKRSTMSDKTLNNFRLYFQKYHNIYGDELNYKNLVNFISDSPLSTNSKSIIAFLIGKFFLRFNYINADEYKQITSMYKQKHSDWSEQDITLDNIYDMLKFFDNNGNLEMLVWVFVTSAIGIRLNQSLALQMLDITFEENRIIFDVINQKHNEFAVKAVKSSKSIGMTYNVKTEYNMQNVLIPFIQNKMLRHRNNPEAFLFNTRERSVQRALKSFSTIYEVNITPHSIRHYVGDKIANEVGILKASLLLGHSNIQTTQRYIKSKIDTSEFIK